MLALLVGLQLELMTPPQQACYLWGWIDRKHTAFYCDRFGNRSNYA